MHRHRAGESAEYDGRAGPDQLGKADAGHCLGQNLSTGPHDRNRGHCAGKDERRDDSRLIILRINPGGPKHGRVEGHGRVRVDKACYYAILVNKLFAKYDFCHIDCILRPGRFRNGAHKWLIGKSEMAIHHIEVSFVHRQIDRFADRSPRVV